MKTVGLLYIGSDTGNLSSAERFLPKKELRKLFPDDSAVALRIIYKKTRYAVGGAQKERKKREKSSTYSWQRDKIVWKHRLINL